MTSRSTRNAALAIIAAALIGAAACHDSNSVTAPPSGGGGASNLVVSAATPADGNATLTATGTIIINNSGTGFDELDLSQTVAGIGHEVVVTWDTSTHAINGVEHNWGNGTTVSGITQCEPSSSACNPANVAIDFAGHTVTFTGLVINDAFGGSATSTLTGTVVW